MEPVSATLLLVLVIGGALVLLLFVLVLARARDFTAEVPVFRASRWTAGNRLFPTQIAVWPDRVVRYSPHLIGHHEESIAIRQVASVAISAGLLFADVYIETTGGSKPIVCHGHTKGDAEEIRRLITACQAKLQP
jgi:hypothetical protein